MKPYIVLLLSCLSFQGLSKPNKTIVCGRFEGTIPPSVTMQYYASHTDYVESYNTKLQQPISAKNDSFRFEININAPINYHILKGEDWVYYNKYLAPGDSLHLIISDTSINFEGTAEQTLAFQFAYAEKFENKDSIAVYQSVWRTLPKYAFADFMTARLASRLKFFDEYFAGKQVSELFRKTFRADEELDYATDLLQFNFRSQYGKNSLNDTFYTAYLRKVNFNNPDLILSHRFSHFTREVTYNYYRTIFQSKPKTNSDAGYIESMYIRDSVAKALLSGTTYDYAVYNLLYDNISGTGRLKDINKAEFDKYCKLLDSNVRVLSKRISDKALQEKIVLQMEELQKPLQPAPDFVMTTLEGKTVHLSDYKGKVIYADFWGVNCAPCVQEIPHIKTMQERYKDNQDIVLLYICFDKSTPALHKFLTEKDFKGTHLVAPGGFASDAASKYKISGLPKYIIIDKAGNLVSRDAPRPSNQPYKILDKLLGTE